MPVQLQVPRQSRTQRKHGSDAKRGILDIATSASRCIGQTTLLGVVCLAPWWYGGVELDIQAWLGIGMLVALGSWIATLLLTIFDRRLGALRIPTLVLPLFGALLLGTVQLSPPISFGRTGAHEDPEIGLVSREASPIPSARALRSDQPRSHSLYPAATRLEIARLGMALIACWLGIALFHDSRSQAWLWGSFAVNGAALSFFGIVQQLSWNGKLFWTVPLLMGGQPFASYVNRNNAAGYLNLCLAAACGLVLWSLCRLVNPSKDGPSLANAGLVALRGQAFRSLHPPIRRSIFEGTSVTAVLLAVVIAAGIVCSLSRGGVLAMLVAGTTGLLLVARTRGILVTGLFSAGILGLCLGLVYWTGLENQFFGRWNSPVGDTLEAGANTRLANWKDALQSTRDFPLIGTGFGTYSFAYLPYQSRPTRNRFYNADNQFVEALVEGGWIGLGLLLLAISLTLLAALRLVRSDSRDPAGLVGLVAIISQMVSAFFDFGPTMFANMTALAVLAGAIAGRAARISGDARAPSLARWLVLPELRPSGVIVAVGLALLAYGWLDLREISAAADCRIAWRDLPKRFDTPDAMTEITLEAAISQLSIALDRRPDDADAHFALANAWIYRYRQQAFKELLQMHQQGGPVPRWSLTDPVVLFHRTNVFQQRSEVELVAGIHNANAVRNNLVPAYRHLTAARNACPLMPGLDVPMAILTIVVGAEKATVEPAFRHALALSPCDADLLDRCCGLAESAGLSRFAEQCRTRRLVLDAFGRSR